MHAQVWAAVEEGPRLGGAPPQLTICPEHLISVRRTLCERGSAEFRSRSGRAQWCATGNDHPPIQPRSAGNSASMGLSLALDCRAPAELAGIGYVMPAPRAVLSVFA
jgi:hypothetical protein